MKETKELIEKETLNLLIKYRGKELREREIRRRGKEEEKVPPALRVINKLREKTVNLRYERNYCVENYEYSKAEYYQKLLQIIGRKLEIAENNYIKPPKLKPQLQCSFCGKSQNEVEKLIAGLNVFICNECVKLAQEIIEEERK